MNDPRRPSTEPQGLRRRVALTMGGKGGVGKTSVMAGLAEWYDMHQVPVTLLDLDIENKARGSLTHFFGGRVPKVNIHTPAGLDAFVDHLSDGAAPVSLADMGAGSGQVSYDWFEKMYPDVAEAGIAFTAIGVVTADPASVASSHGRQGFRTWSRYLIVENCLTDHPDFTYWLDSEQARRFRVCSVFVRLVFDSCSAGCSGSVRLACEPHE